jgi:hypothetical protein
MSKDSLFTLLFNYLFIIIIIININLLIYLFISTIISTMLRSVTDHLQENHMIVTLEITDSLTLLNILYSLK